MDISHYPLMVHRDHLNYRFYSEGHKGRILKSIGYEPLCFRSFKAFNLTLGDVDERTGRVRCNVVSDNGDRDKVLRTVGESVIILCRRHRDAYVMATGSSPARNRLYRMMISKHLEEIEQRFLILGLLGWEMELFRNDRNYDGFMVKAH